MSGPLGVLTVAPAADEGDLERQKLAAGDVRVIATAVRDYAVAHNCYPGKLGQFTTAGEVGTQLVPGYATALPKLDPWGRSYWYWTNGEHFLVGSGGANQADQRWRTELSTDPRGAGTALRSLCSSPGEAAVFFVDGRFCALSKDVTEAPIVGELTERERQVLTVRDLRTIAGAVMAYSIDNNTYPVLVDGTVGVHALGPLLEPYYVRGLPRVDGWEGPYLYWSNGKNFLVYSSGGNGEDRSYDGLLRGAEDVRDALASVCSGATSRLGADVIFANGEPCQWPAGSLEE